MRPLLSHSRLTQKPQLVAHSSSPFSNLEESDKPIDFQNISEDLSDVNDEEIESYLNTPEEAEIKEEIWNEQFSDWTQMMKEKEAQKEKEAADGAPAKVSPREDKSSFSKEKKKAYSEFKIKTTRWLGCRGNGGGFEKEGFDEAQLCSLRRIIQIDF